MVKKNTKNSHAHDVAVSWSWGPLRNRRAVPMAVPSLLHCVWCRRVHGALVCRALCVLCAHVVSVWDAGLLVQLVCAFLNDYLHVKILILRHPLSIRQGDSIRYSTVQYRIPWTYGITATCICATCVDMREWCSAHGVYQPTALRWIQCLQLHAFLHKLQLAFAAD
jgi:hypothetical protein